MVNGVQCAQGNSAAAAMGGGGGRIDRDKMLSSVADTLKLSVDDLKSKLAAGQSLDDVAKAQGVSHDDLVNSIAQSLKANAPSGAPAPSDSQIQAMATRIAGHHRHGHHHQQADAPSPSTSGSPAQPTSTVPSPGFTLNVVA